MTTTTLPKELTGPQVREVQIRSVDADERTFTGIAVPWDDEIEIYGYRESFAKGSVRPADNVLVLYRHRDPIGRVTSYRDTAEGWEVTGRLSDTPTAAEAHTLMRDGVVDRMSIQFEPVTDEVTRNDDGTVTVRRTEVLVREVSLVPFPAYQAAAVTKVRAAPTEPQEEPVTTSTITAEDLTEVRESIESLERRIELGLTPTAPTQRGDLYPSVGHFIRALASQDEAAVNAYNASFEERAWDGATSADTILKDGWLGSLVEIIKKRRPVLSTFATGTLPPKGGHVEHAVLTSDDTQVDVQAAEGDDLAFGKVSIGTATAPVVTLGGWSSLSRQAIERSDVGILNTMWEALAEKYGRASEARARAALTAALAWNGAPGTPAALAEVEADLTTQDGIVTAVLDLVEHFEDAGRALDGIFVDKATFLAIYAVPATDRVLQVSGAPNDKVGSLTVRSAQGDVAGLPFKLLPNAATGTVVAYDETAIKTLEAGGAPFRLQDGNVVNLTQDYSLYGYLASFVQKPAGLVKVVEA